MGLKPSPHNTTQAVGWAEEVVRGDPALPLMHAWTVAPLGDLYLDNGISETTEG